MSGQLIGPIGVLPAAAGGGAPTFTANARPNDQNLGFGSSTATFSAATGTGLVIITVYYVVATAGTGMTGVTCNGSAMTKAAGSSNAGTNVEISEIWYLAGQTANASSSIVFTAASQFQVIGMSSNTLTGVAATPVGTAVLNGASGADPRTAGPITIPATGFGVFGFYNDVGSSLATTPTGGWGGVVDYSNLNAAPSGGSGHTASSGSITASLQSANFSNMSIAFASWGP